MIVRLILTVRHAVQMWRNLSLAKNRSKGTWHDDSIYDLLRHAQVEMNELWTACWEFEHGGGSAQRVAEEAADVSAFTAMIADVARRRER